MKDFTPFRECAYCKNGIGKDTYKSEVLPGEYCSSDCYEDAFIDEFIPSGLKGKFQVKPDFHGGVILA